MTIDKSALRAKAEAATQGEWLVNGKQSVRGVAGEYIAKTNWKNGIDNAAFIAAANPATILALLDEIERLEARNLLQIRVNASQRKRRKDWVDRAGIAEDEALDAEEQRDQLKAENEALRKAVQFSVYQFETQSSSDGSGHGDIARAVLRITASAMTKDPTK